MEKSMDNEMETRVIMVCIGGYIGVNGQEDGNYYSVQDCRISEIEG